jgi:hypothetical protein
MKLLVMYFLQSPLPPFLLGPTLSKCPVLEEFQPLFFANASGCGRSITVIAGSNPVEGIDVRLLLDAFTKLRKATASFAMSARAILPSICLSVRLELGSHWTDFH